jgi:hypothetical protein
MELSPSLSRQLLSYPELLSTVGDTKVHARREVLCNILIEYEILIMC